MELAHTGNSVEECEITYKFFTRSALFDVFTLHAYAAQREQILLPPPDLSHPSNIIQIQEIVEEKVRNQRCRPKETGDRDLKRSASRRS